MRVTYKISAKICGVVVIEELLNVGPLGGWSVFHAFVITHAPLHNRFSVN